MTKTTHNIIDISEFKDGEKRKIDMGNGITISCGHVEDGKCACGEPIVCEELYMCKECLDRHKEQQ